MCFILKQKKNHATLAFIFLLVYPSMACACGGSYRRNRSLLCHISCMFMSMTHFASTGFAAVWKKRMWLCPEFNGTQLRALATSNQQKFCVFNNAFIHIVNQFGFNVSIFMCFSKCLFACIELHTRLTRFIWGHYLYAIYTNVCHDMTEYSWAFLVSLSIFLAMKYNVERWFDIRVSSDI